MAPIYSKSLARAEVVAVGGEVIYTAPGPGPSVVRCITVASNHAATGFLLDNGYPFRDFELAEPSADPGISSVMPLDLRVVLEATEEFVVTVVSLAPGGAVWVTLSGYEFAS